MVRRGLSTIAVMLAWGLSAPGLALGAQGFAVTSQSGFPANGHPSYTTTITFESGRSGPSRALVALMPGVLASLAANPSCIQTVQYTSACHVGDGSANVAGGAPASVTAYLVPPTDRAHDVAGIDLVASIGGTTHAEVQLKQTPSGNVQSLLNIDFSALGAIAPFITSTSLTINGTLNGKPFTRMPSNCSPGPSTLTVQYADGSSETTNAAPDFAPTGCGALPYSPQLDAVLTKDSGDSGVRVVTTVTQAADEAASAVNTLVLPWPAVGPNFSALSLQNTTTAVGAVTAHSPLLPVPLMGQAYLTGSLEAPTLTLRFPPPNALTLVGAIDLKKSAVTFDGVPDVPQTALTVDLFGGPRALETATCTPPNGTASARFTGQNGRSASVSRHVRVIGCPSARPAISQTSLTGRRTGKPTLRFTLAEASGGPGLRSLTVSLPRGLTLNPRGVARGLSAPGVRSVAVRHNKLTLTLRRPAASLAVKLSAPLLQAGRHLSRRPQLRVIVTDAAGRATILAARLS